MTKNFDMSTASSNKTITIAVHDGSHHADDIFGVAILQLVHPDSRVVRTRDPETIAQAEFAVDVGGEWDPARGRFDHHQKDFAGARPNGVGYASAGLVWAAYGKDCLKPWRQQLNDANVDAIVQAIDDELMVYLDKVDTGADFVAPGLFGLTAQLDMYNPTWLEEDHLDKAERARLKYVRFMVAVEHVQRLLLLVINAKVAECTSANLIRNSARRDGGRTLLLGNGAMPWLKVVCLEMPDVLFVVYPESTGRQYQVRTVPDALESYVARVDLPESWAGLRDGELAQVTGVPDAVFCHTKRFIAGAGSLDGALTMATLALQEYDASK